MFEDDNSKEWNKKDQDEQSTDTQSLFQSLILDRATNLYYSFCQNEVYDSGNDWHCAVYQKCMDWRVWHCEKCNQCMYYGEEIINDFCLNISTI